MYVEAMVGEIRAFASDTVPDGWQPCSGQVLQIRDNPALFSLLGIEYGGNGNTTFALPDLRAKIAIHEGDRRRLGQRSHAVSGGATGELQGFLALNFCICTAGIFPRRP
jgi:microcystin-dependent protein